jgi:ssDNA-binding Zn-finger/Zn-ribbon topoisomerase 1
MEIQMATEQLEAEVGKRYWGAKCPECGEMTAHAPEHEKPGEAQVTMTCPNGHRFSARTEELLHFEWGAQ